MNLKKRKKKKLDGTDDDQQGLEENDKISRVCVRFLDGSSIYTFD